MFATTCGSSDVVAAGRPERRARVAPADGTVAEKRDARTHRAQIGIVSDTHGRLDPSVLAAFAGVTHIIHAGDIGKRSVLRKLEKVAPVTAVSGNTDIGKLAKELPTQTVGEAAGVTFLVAHKPKQLRRLLRRGAPEGVRLVITGHLHEPQVRWEDGVLHLNPGTASSPEEGDPAPTVAVITVHEDLLTVTFVPVGPATALHLAGRPAGPATDLDAASADGVRVAELSAASAAAPVAALPAATVAATKATPVSRGRASRR